MAEETPLGDLVRPLLASGNALEWFSGSDLLAFAFALTPAKMLTAAEAAATLRANGLCQSADDPQLASLADVALVARLRSGARSDAAFLGDEAFCLAKGVELRKRVVEAFARRSIKSMRKELKQRSDQAHKALRSPPKPKPPPRPPPPASPPRPDPPPPIPSAAKPTPPSITFDAFDAGDLDRTLAAPHATLDAWRAALAAERPAPDAPIAAVRLEIDAPKLAPARALAARFKIRNAVCEPTQVSPCRASYLALSIGYSIRADTERFGDTWSIANAVDHASTSPAVGLVIEDALRAGQAKVLATPSPSTATARVVVAQVDAALRDAVKPTAVELRRLHADAHAHAVARCKAQVDEVRTPWPPVDRGAVDAVVEKLLLDRGAQLDTLDARFAARVTPFARAWMVVELPAALVVVRVRRKKDERELLLRVAPGAAEVDVPACEGCGVPAEHPAVCEQRMHLLCTRCAPAEKKIVCPTCATRAAP